MFVRISRKKYRVFAFDIETHNDEESIARKETGMWLGSFIDESSSEDDEKSYLYNMDTFLDRINEESARKRGSNHDETRPCNNLAIYIYNTSFEWSFMLPYLLKRGFTFKEKIEKDDEYVYNTISTKSVSSVWLINLKFGKKNGMIIIKDLAKIFAGGLKAVAKAFKLPTQKGEIDYRLNRRHGNDFRQAFDSVPWLPTQEEKKYCFKDTRILIDILLQLLEKDDKDFWNSSSMATYSMRKLIKRGWPRACRPYGKFREDYPELAEEETTFLRKTVAGGITYAPTNWQFKTITQKILHIDKHQMHPSSAYFNVMPYGEGEKFMGRPRMGRINACHIRISYDSVKLHSIINLIGIPFVENREMWVWDFEIPTMYKCYENLEITYIDGYSYHMKRLPWRQYYADNYNSRLIAKKNNDEFYTLLYKLLNNSSYGKLLEKPHNEIYVNIINELEMIDSEIIEKDIEKQSLNAKYTYLPVGSCIPAYSRVDLIETALLFGWEKITYFDTDSIFVIYDEETKRVWESLDHTDWLGGWGLEEIADRAQFVCPKRYKTEKDGKASIKAGGINFNSLKEEQIKAKGLEVKIEEYNIPFDEVNLINSRLKVQRAYRCKGGTIIEFQDKEMSVQPKYQSTYEKNLGSD